jgi:hypothetical protein
MVILVMTPALKVIKVRRVIKDLQVYKALPERRVFKEDKDLV